MKPGLNQYFEEVLLSPITQLAQENPENLNLKVSTRRNRSNQITLSQYFEKELLEESSAAERMPEPTDNSDEINEVANIDEEDDDIDIYTSYASYMSSSDPGSDNLLVTFDYGFEDSLDDEISLNFPQLELTNSEVHLNKSLFKIPEEEILEDLLAVSNSEKCSQSSNIFQVHQIQHSKSNSNINTRASSCISIASSLVHNNIDTSGDYGSWAQSESEQEEAGNNNYCYEDLIKKEVLSHDDDDGNDVTTVTSNDGKEVLINFKFDEDSPPPRWFNINNNNNEQLYYRSADYLN